MQSRGHAHACLAQMRAGLWSGVPASIIPNPSTGRAAYCPRAPASAGRAARPCCSPAPGGTRATGSSRPTGTTASWAGRAARPRPARPWPPASCSASSARTPASPARVHLVAGRVRPPCQLCLTGNSGHLCSWVSCLAWCAGAQDAGDVQLMPLKAALPPSEHVSQPLPALKGSRLHCLTWGNTAGCLQPQAQPPSHLVMHATTCKVACCRGASLLARWGCLVVQAQCSARAGPHKQGSRKSCQPGLPGRKRVHAG